MRSQRCQRNTAKPPRTDFRPSAVGDDTDSPPCSERTDGATRKPAIVASLDSSPEDQRKFRDVALTHLDELYTYGRFLLPKAEDAEDAVYECYLNAMLNYRGQSGPSAKLWLITILRTICVRQLIRDGIYEQAAEINDLEFVTDQLQTNGKHASGLSKSPNSLTDPCTQTLIGSLPLPLREAFVLRECMGLSYSEIAKVSGISALTVSSRLSKAWALLRHRDFLSFAQEAKTRLAREIRRPIWVDTPHKADDKRAETVISGVYS
jgi:RNA polymerase sigma factor (sigma-70 family)